jgi:tripartite-type tricarboxylate transporter receptor subunit TctC
MTAFPSLGTAEEFPSHPITLVVPFGVGGGTDALGRLVAQKLGAGFGKSVVVENKPGAGTMLAAGAVAKANADGYTLLFVTNSAIAVIPAIYKTPLSDPIQDFVPLSMVTEDPLFLAINPKLPFQAVAELIKFAKENPGKLSAGTAGIGSAPHIFMELFTRKAMIEVLNVPYNSTGQALNDVMAGHVDIYFTGPTPASS